MPLWKVYHPVDSFKLEDKQALAVAVTDFYGRVMPRFYVNVIFQEVDASSIFIGGEPRSNFVRIWIDHIARELPDEEAAVRFITHANKIIAPWIKDKGYDWEFHVDETPFTLWSVQGFLPPRQGTEDEKRWMAEDRPSPRTHS